MADLRIGNPVTSLSQPLATKPGKVDDATKTAGDSGPECSSWDTSAIALVILAANCGAAVYHSWHDPWSVAFVAASFLILVLLFVALRVFESLPPGSPRRIHARAAVWALSTAITIMFSYRVAALMPFPVAVVVWGMAGSTIFAGFYMFFVRRDEGEVAAEEKPSKVADMAQITCTCGWVV